MNYFLAKVSAEELLYSIITYEVSKHYYITISPKLLRKAVKLAQKPKFRSTTEISQELSIDIHLLRMLFTELRKSGEIIPHNRLSKVRKLLEETKKIL